MMRGKVKGVIALCAVVLLTLQSVYGADSLNMRLVGNWPFGPSLAVAYDPSGSIAFCGSGGGVYILDLSTPSLPTEISDIRTSGLVEGLFYDNSTSTLYIAAGYGGLEIWDVQTPASPAKLGSYDTPGYPKNVVVSGSYAYIADWFSGLRIVDVSNPASPSETGYYDTPGGAHDIAISGSYAYIAD